MSNFARTFLGLSLVLGLTSSVMTSTASAQTTVVVTSTPVTSTPTAPGTVPPPPPVSGAPIATATATATGPAGSAPRTDGRVTTATAETDTEIRQREEESRIAAATRSGLLDAREANHLARAMANLQAYQERAYADGVLTLREQARLSRLHTRIDRTITRAIAR
jgi:serine/threonine protein kinase HipA of HipAB toxin-antitoxin module